MRYSDNDKHLGKYITYGKSDFIESSVILSSGSEDGECFLHFGFQGYYLILELPKILKPAQGEWDNSGPVEFGFRISDSEFLQVMYGAQTNSSSSTKSWSYFLPWTQHRFVRHTLRQPSWEIFWTWVEPKSGSGKNEFRAYCAEFNTIKNGTDFQKPKFKVRDFDQAEIFAETYIEEREWKRGTGFFKFLSLFCKPILRRSLNITFSAEVGPDKGSWKGGLIGTSIDVEENETAESAFKRFCAEPHRSKSGNFCLTYLGEANA